MKDKELRKALHESRIVRVYDTGVISYISPIQSDLTIAQIHIDKLKERIKELSESHEALLSHLNLYLSHCPEHDEMKSTIVKKKRLKKHDS